MSQNGMLKELKDLKSPISPRDIQLHDVSQEKQLVIMDNAATELPKIENEVPKAITNDEEDIAKFFITDAKNESTMKLDESLLRKSKINDDTLLKGANYSIFDSQIIQKPSDEKKVKHEINLMASDTMFYDTIPILDKINNSQDLMKAMNEMKSKRDESILSHYLIQELLDRRLKIENYIEMKQIKELVKDNKLYRGVTISPTNFELIDHM